MAIDLGIQLEVLRSFLEFYVLKQLLSTANVIHCRSWGYSIDARDQCLRVMQSYLVPAEGNIK